MLGDVAARYALDNIKHETLHALAVNAKQSAAWGDCTAAHAFGEAIAERIGERFEALLTFHRRELEPLGEIVAAFLGVEL